MATSASGELTEWGALADSSEEERQAQMGKRYAELLQMSEEERVSALEGMARAEYQLPDDKLRTFTSSRLKVWMGMDLEQGRVIARSYDQAMLRLPGPMAMKRVSSVQTVIRGFTPEETEQLRELIPSILREVPRRATPSPASGPQPRPAAQERKPTRSFWRFWQRK